MSHSSRILEKLPYLTITSQLRCLVIVFLVMFPSKRGTFLPISWVHFPTYTIFALTHFPQLNFSIGLSVRLLSHCIWLIAGPLKKLQRAALKVPFQISIEINSSRLLVFSQLSWSFCLYVANIFYPSPLPSFHFMVFSSWEEGP